jgi:serine/threonine protein kinase
MAISKTYVSGFCYSDRFTKVIITNRQVNILISDDCHVQLCDFGLVAVGNMTEGRLSTAPQAAGTRNWMSPELVENIGTRYRVTEADDVYALGCLCYYVSLQSYPV